MGNQNWKCYLSSALTGLDEKYKIFYATIGLIVAAFGGSPYLPQDVTDPLADPDISPEEVYRLDRAAVLGSDIMLAYGGIPAFGVGIEMEMAHQAHIPVILLSEQDTKVSRILRGCPAVNVSNRSRMLTFIHLKNSPHRRM